jgi:hypothetical protein
MKQKYGEALGAPPLSPSKQPATPLTAETSSYLTSASQTDHWYHLCSYKEVRSMIQGTLTSHPPTVWAFSILGFSALEHLDPCWRHFQKELTWTVATCASLSAKSFCSFGVIFHSIRMSQLCVFLRALKASWRGSLVNLGGVLTTRQYDYS